MDTGRDQSAGTSRYGRGDAIGISIIDDVTIDHRFSGVSMID